MNGFLGCPLCAVQYLITEGIVCLLDNEALDEDSAHEQQLRNMYARRRRSKPENWYANYTEKAERLSTMTPMQPLRGKTALELGCGPGRFTCLIADECRNLLAMDFSIESLRLLSRRLQPRLMWGFYWLILPG
jgi:tRNA G46 methylase TrmB